MESFAQFELETLLELFGHGVERPSLSMFAALEQLCEQLAEFDELIDPARYFL